MDLQVSRTGSINGQPFAFERVALLLQGGGALGSYQAGVYQALHEAGVEPDWIAGISIGAINCALIAGNAPEKRLDALKAFWEQVTEAPDYGFADSWLGLWQGDVAHGWANQLTAARTMASGSPGFFATRLPPPMLLPAGAPGATSFYDTAPLKATLVRLVDFDRINAAKAMRFSVGAVNVRSGNFAYFDTGADRPDIIRPEHIMASGALPPGFPAIEIDGEFYWDGGVVSNTPLDWILSNLPLLDTLAFQVDLWSARGPLPRDLAEVAVRLKEIQYSSRTRASTNNFRDIQRARGLVQTLLDQLPAEIKTSVEAVELCRLADASVHNIVQLIYHSPPDEAQSKDYNFARAVMEKHWAQGLADARRALAQPAIFVRPSEANGVQTFDFCSAR